MAYLNPLDAFEHLKGRVLEGIQEQFARNPIVGKTQSLHLEGLEVKDSLHPDDIRGQQKAKTEGDTWAVPVYATVALKENATGKVIDRRHIRIAEIPKTTSRYSYIIDGQEYQVDNQWQLRPGVYTRRKANGDLVSKFNAGKQFDVVLDPASKVFQMKYGKSRGSLPIYPLMKTLGVSDEELTAAWGQEILDANKTAPKSSNVLERFYKMDKPYATAVPTHEVAAEHFYDAMEKAKLRPESTQLTLGKPFTHVTGDALKLATEKMLKVQAGHPEDDRDSLVFKDLRSAGDFAHDAIHNAGMNIKQRATRQINKAKDVWDVLKFDMFNNPIKKSLSSGNAAARTATQINPLEMVSSAQQTTIMGSGGIQSERAVSAEAKFVNPSHLGFLDPLNTPEGCFDDQTEVFTDTGWLYWGAVSSTTRFACLIGGRLEFHYAEALQAYYYHGRMLGVRKPWLEYLVTPNHRMLCRPVDKGAKYRVVAAQEMHGKVRNLKVAHAPYLGVNQRFFMLPFIAGNNSSKNVSRIKLNDWAEFLGWFLSEGHARYVEKTSDYFVHLFQSEVNADCCRRIENLLERLPFTWSASLRENGRNKYTIGVKQLAHYMQQFGLSHEKYIPECAFSWPVPARKRLLESLLLGDGRLTASHINSNQDSKQYTTTSIRLALGVERLMISLGHGTATHRYEDARGFRPVYEVCQLKKAETSTQPAGKARRDPFYSVEYDGTVYCASVPGTFLYVRRNGKHPFWCGNSKTGITLRLPVGVRQFGHEVKIPLYNLLSKKTELVTPGELLESNVVLPDQVRWDGGTPHPLHKLVRASAKGNEIRDVAFEDAHYVLRHPSQLFNMTSNLIPFLGNTSGNRASMASRHMEQAVSLKHREAPLVQVDGPNSISTFEELMGQRASHASPVDGKVIDIKKDAIFVADASGTKHEVQIYNNYKLNDAKSVMHSTPIVSIGDHVKKDQTIADTNFSKKGVLALGTNLRVAYLPFKGYNFEDGVVISESAAKKLSSEHLQQLTLAKEPDIVLDKKRFHIAHPGLVHKEQYDKLDSDGVVRVGQIVKPGDPLIAAMKPFRIKDRTGLSAIRRSMSGAHTDKSLRWDSDFEGEVVGVHKGEKSLSVHVRTVEPMQVGDKISNRFGGKGIVTMILPNQEMPHTKDGKHIEVALNPSGVPGRMNVGQLFETAASKIAEKTGKPYIVKNFATNVDSLAKIKADLKEHGLTDTEELKDPGTGQSLGQVMLGPQHMFKLVHQVEKKLSVRSGSGSMPGGAAEHYDLNLQPAGGADTGGQSMGTLGLFALLAHGAKANIREMQSYKSEGPDPQTDAAKRWPSDHHRIWAAIQTGHPLPPPKPSFAFQKFEDMLRGVGVNVDKKGHDLVLSPMTNAQILALAPKELPHPADMLDSKMDKNGDPKPRRGGLWDEQLTGGLGGRRWTRIALAEPLPNPVFETPVRALTGLSARDFADVIHGVKGVSSTGAITAAGTGTTGGPGIKVLLDRIDVARDLPKAEAQLKTVKGQGVDKALKKVKYLRALKQINTSPSDAYMLHNIPVMPPIMRPVSTLPDGHYRFDDTSQLYSDFAKINDKLKDPTLARNLTDEGKADLRKDYYDGVKAFMGMGTQKKDADWGLLQQIAGKTPKDGFFQSRLTSRKQDLAMRSTIVPEPALDLDEVGLPRHAALELFKPFVVRKLKEMGAIPDEMQGAAFIEKKNPQVWRALDKVMEDRPVLLKRDPALHKYSVQAFKAKAVAGNAIQIHPLVTGGFTADFDGDAMSAYVPITREACAEARKMMPSNNLFSEATGKLMYQPTLESALGLYKLSTIGKDSHQKFEHPGAALDAVRSGQIHYTDTVHIGSKKTTPGRILLASAVPDAMQDEVMHDLAYRINGKGLSTLLTGIAKHYAPQYGEVVNKLKDLGNGASFGAAAVPRPSSAGHALRFSVLDKTPVAVHDSKKDVFIPIGAHTLSLEDFTPDIAMRERVLSPAHKEVAEIYANKKLSKGEQDRQAVMVYEAAGTEMKLQHEKKQDKDPNNLFTMYRAGVKPGWDQYKQMVLAPMIYKDSGDNKLPTPVTKSYSEGFDVGSYWTQMHGARRGSVMKVQEVSGPGYLSKLLMSNMMHVLVNSHDCGTDKGVLIDASEEDAHDRFLQQDFTHGHMHIPAGTVLTPDIISKIRSARKDAKLLVRSPLKCEDEQGICQKCAGLNSSGQCYDLGHNIGIQSAQAVGERGVQLALKSFHTGGVGEQKGGSKLLSSFDRFDQLVKLPEKIPNESTLAMRSGRIDKITPTATGVDIYIGDRRHHVGRDPNGMALNHKLPGVDSNWKVPVVGAHFDAGDSLSDPSRTTLNPHHLYEATGSIEKVQNHLTNEIHGLFKEEGIKRRSVETVVRAMSNLTKIVDPGDHPDVLRGEFKPMSTVYRMNQELLRDHKTPIEHEPVMKGVNAMPLALQEDWMAKLQHERLRGTLTEAAAVCGVSHLHGTHPIPAVAYGSEIGLTSKDSLKPGYGHLRDVPAHHY